MHGKGRKAVGTVLACNLRKLRKARGMSQEALEARSGVSQTMISAIERNATSPAADTLQALSVALGVESWQLQMEGLPDELLFSDTLPDLLFSAFAELSPEDRVAIDTLIARLRPR